jgi:amino acid transporter
MGDGTVSKKVVPRVLLRHGEGNKDHLTSFGGLAALSLDALSSVAYGPEAIVLVLAAAGASALRLTLPVTLAIAGLLAVLVISYCQVIAVHPDGGGAYAVAKKDLGATVSLLAAASLVVDYVLTVGSMTRCASRSGPPRAAAPSPAPVIYPQSVRAADTVARRSPGLG